MQDGKDFNIAQKQFNEERTRLLWVMSVAEERFQQKNEEQAFVFKVQMTCKRCQRPKTFDIGPTKECY